MAYHHVYRPLRRYLLAVPPDQQQVQLSLDDLEALLGPRSVSGLPTWTLLGVADAISVERGFRARVDRQRRAVTFTRQEPAPQEPA